MSLLRVVGHVYRAAPAALLWLTCAVAAGYLVWSAPPESVYRSVPTIAPAIFAGCTAATLCAAVLALPRSEASEVTAARSLRWVRAGLVIGLYAALAAVALLVCVLAGSLWFLLPVVRGEFVAAAGTFAAAAVLPVRHVASAAMAYILLCYVAGRGEAWWDVLLAPPTPPTILAAAAVSVAGGAVFAHCGARALPPDDEY